MSFLQILKHPPGRKEVSYVTTKPDYSHDVSCHNSENWPSRNANKPALQMKSGCTEDNQDDPGQTPDNQFQEDCQS